MRKDIKALGGGKGAIPGAIPGQGQGGALAEIRSIIQNVNEGIRLFKDLQATARGNENAQGAVQGLPNNPVNPRLPVAPLDPITPFLNLFEALEKAGHGGKTIGDLLAEIAPFTVTQAKGVLRNARSKR